MEKPEKNKIILTLINNSLDLLNLIIQIIGVQKLEISPMFKEIVLTGLGTQKIELTLNPKPSLENSQFIISLIVKGKNYNYKRELKVLLNTDLIKNKNPGFESDSFIKGPQKSDWSLPTRVLSRLIEQDKKIFHSGKASIRIGNNGDINQCIVCYPDIPGKIWGNLVFSVWSKSEGVILKDKPEDYAIAIEGGGPEPGDGSWIIANFDSGTHDWQRKEDIWKIPKNTTPWGIILHLMFKKGKGTVWFDNAELIVDGIILEDKIIK